MFESIFDNSLTKVGLKEVLICSICALVFGFIIALIHKLTTKSNKNFLVTLTVLPFLVQMVILMVNGNLGTSVAIVGAFNLIRFRSMPGNSKQILSVFFAMTIGLALGMGSIGLAFLITVIGCLAMIILNYLNLFLNDNSERILDINVPENVNYVDIFKEEFEKYTKKATLEKVKTVNMGSIFELKYYLILKNNINEKEFIDSLRIKNENLKIALSSYSDNDEL